MKLSSILLASVFSLSIVPLQSFAANAAICESAGDVQPYRDPRPTLLQNVMGALPKDVASKEWQGTQEFRAREFPLSYYAQFQKDAHTIASKLEEYFPGDAQRLEQFNAAKRLGELMFEQGKIPSRDLAIVYLTFSAIISDLSVLDDDSQFSEVELSLNNVLRDIHALKRAVDEIGTHINDESSQLSQFLALLNRDHFFLPRISESGLEDIEVLNACFAHDVVYLGLPTNRSNAFDNFKNQPSITVILHDLGHADRLRDRMRGRRIKDFIINAKDDAQFETTFDEHIEERRILWEDMCENNLEREFAVPYFLTFHEDFGEDGRVYIRKTPDFRYNPLQHALASVRTSLLSQNGEVDYVKQSIMAQKGFIYPLAMQRGFKGKDRPISTIQASAHAKTIDISNSEDILYPRPVDPLHSVASQKFVTFEHKDHPDQTLYFMANAEVAQDQESLLQAIVKQRKFPLHHRVVRIDGHLYLCQGSAGFSDGHVLSQEDIALNTLKTLNFSKASEEREIVQFRTTTDTGSSEVSHLLLKKGQKFENMTTEEFAKQVLAQKTFYQGSELAWNDGTQEWDIKPSFQLQKPEFYIVKTFDDITDSTVRPVTVDGTPANSMFVFEHKDHAGKTLYVSVPEDYAEALQSTKNFAELVKLYAPHLDHIDTTEGNFEPKAFYDYIVNAQKAFAKRYDHIFNDRENMPTLPFTPAM